MRHTCLFGLLAVLILAGCSRKREAPVVVVETKDESGASPSPNVVDAGKPKDVVVPPVAPVERGPDLAGYEAAMLEAVDFLAQRKYPEALAAMEKAQKCHDTGAIQREIDRVRAVLAEQSAAEKSVQDVKTVLADGKPDDAARLAGEALAQHGGGDRADELSQLKQQADAVATAADEAAARLTKLKAEADTALNDKNLRAGAVALEQALALGEDPDLAARLKDVRDRLQTYDDNRAAAIELRRDPARLEEGLACLKKAAAAWDTLQVRQEIDEYRLIMEKRRDRLAVADFEVRGDFGVPAAGQVVAEELMSRFKPRFDVVERAQLARILDEMRLGANDLSQPGVGSEVSRLAKVRYVVVGSVTPLAGITVQARLVEASTGLVVQTARASAPSMEALLPLLERVAQVLQMTDDQKLAFEARLAAEAVEVKPADAAPVQEIPPPPPINATVVVAPIVTWTPRPPVLGALVIADFAALPPVVVVPPTAPPALSLVIRREDPRRNRLLRLSLEIGDNLFRRGRFADALRHFSLAFSLAGPRREISLRLNACNDALPPAASVPGLPIPPRPRLAVFGFYLGAPVGLVPANVGDLAADQFASYCGGYQVIDRGEVCWYMGRLGITLRDLMRDPVAQRCLAQALNARFFVFGSIQQTASFDVSTHLIDAESGVRTGTATIHVQDHQELKLRMSELVHQIGMKPAEQKKLQEQGKAAEKTLIEARRLLAANDPNKAAELLRTLPASIAQQSLLAAAQTKQRLAAFDEARRKETADRAAALQAAKKRQAELAAKLAQAKQRAEEEAKGRSEADRKKLQAQREKAAALLHQQALAAAAKGDQQKAMHLLQGSVALKPEDSAFKQLAQATLAADKAARERADAERRKRDAARQAQVESARKRAENQILDQANATAERRATQAAHDQALHDGFVKQAKDLMKKDPEAALAAAQAAGRVKSSMQSVGVLLQARNALAQADAEKKGAEEKRKLEEERKQREAAALQVKRNQEMYLEAMKKGDDAVTAKKYVDAVAQYQAALKLFRTDVVLSKLKSAGDLLIKEKAAAAANEAEAKRATQVKDLISQGQKALDAKKYAQAAEFYKQARKLAPDNADALAGLTRAEREQGIEADRIRREREAKTKPIDPKAKQREEDYKLAMDAARAAVKKNNLAGAVNAFKEALRLKPGDPTATEALASAEKLLAAEEAKKKKVVTPTPDPKMKQREAAYANWMKQGDAALAAKKYADAAKAYDEALKIKPGDDAAIKGKRAATMPPKQTSAPSANPKAEYDKAMLQGATLEKQGKYAGAVTAYQTALKSVAKAPAGNADAFKAYMGIGRSEQAAKRYAEAVKAYEEALKRMPGDADAKARLQRAKANKP
jgi:tetratricopeptide (TPR) repeat protein